MTHSTTLCLPSDVLLNHRETLCRQGFSRLNDLLPAVVEHIKKAGPEKGVNVDSIAGRVTMDAISLAIFGKTMGCTDDLAQESKPRLAELTADGELLLNFPALLEIPCSPWSESDFYRGKSTGSVPYVARCLYHHDQAKE